MDCLGLWRRHLLADDEEEQGVTAVPTEVDHFPGINCTNPAIQEFPRPIIPQYVRARGGLLVHFLIAAYMFLGLSIVCDDYFVPALERMVECTYIGFYSLTLFCLFVCCLCLLFIRMMKNTKQKRNDECQVLGHQSRLVRTTRKKRNHDDVDWMFVIMTTLYLSDMDSIANVAGRGRSYFYGSRFFCSRTGNGSHWSIYSQGWYGLMFMMGHLFELSLLLW